MHFLAFIVLLGMLEMNYTKFWTKFEGKIDIILASLAIPNHISI